jgi:hypothetical protein
MLRAIDREIEKYNDQLQAALSEPSLKVIRVGPHTHIDIDRRYNAILTHNNRTYTPLPHTHFRWEYVADDVLFRTDFATHTRTQPKKPYFESVRVVDNPGGTVTATFTVWDTEYRGSDYSWTQSRKLREIIFVPE